VQQTGRELVRIDRKLHRAPSLGEWLGEVLTPYWEASGIVSRSAPVVASCRTSRSWLTGTRRTADATHMRETTPQRPRKAAVGNARAGTAGRGPGCRSGDLVFHPERERRKADQITGVLRLIDPASEARTLLRQPVA
jgi:hypothetical protein